MWTEFVDYVTRDTHRFMEILDEKGTLAPQAANDNAANENRDVDAGEVAAA